MANIDNLRPVKTKDEARERGKNGGIKSGIAKREKKLLSQQMAEYFGKKDLTEVFDAIIARKDNVTVSLIKEGREATEGSKVQVDGGITIKIDNDDNQL